MWLFFVSFKGLNCIGLLKMRYTIYHMTHAKLRRTTKNDNMKCTPFFTFMIFFLMVVPATGEMSISHIEVKAVVANEIIVKYSWEIDVSFSEDKPVSCKMKITFFDASGVEIHSKSQYISLSHGSNHFTGHGICKPEIWKKLKEYKAHIECK